jgi:hypothetical protein
MQWNKILLILYLAKAGTNDNKQQKCIETCCFGIWKRLYKTGN